MREVTLRDVANLAGVSTATVSHVVNESKYVSDKLQAKVFEAMKTLNYHPNIIAKSLKVKESKLIGLLISDITNPFFSAVVRGIEDELTKNGYNLLLCNTDEDVLKEKHYTKVLLGKRVDGLVVSAAGNTGAYFKELESIRIPLVFLNRCPEFLSFDTVMTNNMKGAYVATEHLIQHGYSNIALISGPQDLRTGRDRFLGYQQAIEDHGLELNQRLIKEGKFDIQSGYELMKELMEQEKQPEAVFISNNFMTLGAYRYLKRKKIKIPNDIAIIGYDDPEWATISDPPLTAIRQPAYNQGLEAAKLIVERIKVKDTNQKIKRLLDPTIIIRSSCGCDIEE